MSEPIMPVFVFDRRRDIELEVGFILAGTLIVDIPSKTILSDDDQQLIAEIVQALTARARSGQMPDNATVYGWPNGERPPDADATINDHALMDRWAKTRVKIVLRIDPRTDGMVRIDSDGLRQIGVIKEH